MLVWPGVAMEAAIEAEAVVATGEFPVVYVVVEAILGGVPTNWYKIDIAISLSAVYSWVLDFTKHDLRSMSSSSSRIRTKSKSISSG